MTNHTHYDKAEARALKNSAIPTAVMASEGCRFDSVDQAAVFFARELDYVKSQSYDAEYPEMTALSLFPISSEADQGAETIIYHTYDKTGLAKIIDNYSTDLPRADVDIMGTKNNLETAETVAENTAGNVVEEQKFPLLSYAANCNELFNISISTFAGATERLKEDGRYTKSEIEKTIKKWMEMEVK